MIYRKNNEKKTVFAGASSTLRAHISRQGGAHWETYRDGCSKNDIPINPHAIPPDVKQRADQNIAETLGYDIHKVLSSIIHTDFISRAGGTKQTSIEGFTTPVKPVEEWTKDGSIDHIIHFIVETDQVCF